ncbi:MAG: hypothetical protein PHT54_04870, partial [Candidatus Nanoarchaeia archaeon]|nr:hypothetical protein [Candidatus Nanoarchaeia archaeon]
AVISLIIIPLVIYPYFGETNDVILKEDLKSIKQDFNPGKALAGENLAMTLAGLQFNDSIYIVWPEELKEEVLNTYSFEIKPKSNTLKYLTFSSDLRLNNPEKDKNLLLLERKGHASSQYKEVKCYRELCVYEQG